MILLNDIHYELETFILMKVILNNIILFLGRSHRSRLLQKIELDNVSIGGCNGLKRN